MNGFRRARATGSLLRFDGWIAGLGTSSGTRIVVGHWPGSPFGPFSDVMLERPDGERVLLAPTRETALAVFRHIKVALAPYKRVRRIEFIELPKTISGKIRRVELRRLEVERARLGERPADEHREEDFPELRE